MITEEFDRLVRLKLCRDTALHRALFLHGVASALLELLKASPEGVTATRAALAAEVDDFIFASERRPAVRRSFEAMREAVAATPDPLEL